jgi:hypothetical protein
MNVHDTAPELWTVPAPSPDGHTACAVTAFACDAAGTVAR